MYGLIPSASTENCDKAPPAKISKKPKIFVSDKLVYSFVISTNGIWICTPIRQTNKHNNVTNNQNNNVNNKYEQYIIHYY